MNTQTLVEDIAADLVSVKWAKTTPTGKLFSHENAETYSGTGERWTHNLIIWKDGEIERCDGAVVALGSPLIVRYTPTIAQAAMKAVKESLCQSPRST